MSLEESVDKKIDQKLLDEETKIRKGRGRVSDKELQAFHKGAVKAKELTDKATKEFNESQKKGRKRLEAKDAADGPKDKGDVINELKDQWWEEVDANERMDMIEDYASGIGLVLEEDGEDEKSITEEDAIEQLKTQWWEEQGPNDQLDMIDDYVSFLGIELKEEEE